MRTKKKKEQVTIYIDANKKAEFETIALEKGKSLAETIVTMAIAGLEVFQDMRNESND